MFILLHVVINYSSVSIPPNVVEYETLHILKYTGLACRCVRLAVMLFVGYIGTVIGYTYGPPFPLLDSGAGRDV